MLVVPMPYPKIARTTRPIGEMSLDAVTSCLKEKLGGRECISQMGRRPSIERMATQFEQSCAGTKDSQ
jgi:hypothetical protein